MNPKYLLFCLWVFFSVGCEKEVPQENLSDKQYLLRQFDNNNFDSLEMVINKYGPDVKDDSGWPLIFLAIQYDRRKEFDMLIEHGADINILNDYTRTTSIHFSIVSEKDYFFQKLLDLGADVNRSKNRYSFPLDAASYNGDLNKVKSLIGHGADINLKNYREETPLFAAVAFRKVDIAIYLISQLANLDARDKFNQSFVEYAVTLDNNPYNEKASALNQKFIDELLLHVSPEQSLYIQAQVEIASKKCGCLGRFNQ